MEKIQIKMTVLFNGTFWIAVFEKITNNTLSVATVTFGSEPNDTEIQKFILYKYSKLKFSDTVFVKSRPKIVSPKRMKRVVNKQLNKAVGTKSQQAIKQDQEKRKTLKKQILKQKREDIIKRNYEIRKQKKHQKHKGR